LGFCFSTGFKLMAVGAIPSTFSSIAWQPNVLVVGNREVSQHLSDLVHQCGSSLKIEADPNVKEGVADLAFGRDCRIVRLDGSYLFPYCIKMKKLLLDVRFKALLPSSSQHIIPDWNELGYGTGVELGSVKKAIQDAQINGISFTQGMSSIEGGNCHLFIKDGTPKAIVGIHSVLLSLIGLNEQKYFTGPTIKKKLIEYCEGIKTPSEESIRIARNIQKFIRPLQSHPYVSHVPVETIRSLIERFIAPLAKEEEDSHIYEIEALILQAKIMLIK
jgi:hypothetical protein